MCQYVPFVLRRFRKLYAGGSILWDEHGMGGITMGFCDGIRFAIGKYHDEPTPKHDHTFRGDEAFGRRMR